MASDRTARLEARLPAHIYATLKRAAELKGRTLSDFVVSAAHEAAHKAIEEETVWKLIIEDQIAFAKALIDPPKKPNATMRRARKLHAHDVEMR
mgnify:CR=1 FL=1